MVYDPKDKLLLSIHFVVPPAPFIRKTGFKRMSGMWGKSVEVNKSHETERGIQ